jgi:hypothetical protein
MKKKIQKKMAQSQWRWDNIGKLVGGLVLVTVAIIGLIVGCNQPEAKAAETKVTLYDVPIDIDLLDHILGLCADYEIPVELVLAVIEKESNFKADAVSKAGAIGLMQVIPEHHEPRMKQLKCTDLFDPKKNITVGMDFLSELLEKYKGDKHKALTAYNHGEKGANDKFFSKGIYQTEYSSKVLETVEKIKGEITEMYIRTDDPVKDYDRYAEEQDKLLEKCPVCSYCDKHIQDDYLYEINDELICEECIKDNFRKNVEDYIE